MKLVPTERAVTHTSSSSRRSVWREAGGPTITLRNAQVAEDLVSDELDRRFFRDRYEKGAEAEQLYSAAIADLGDGRHASAEIAFHMGMTNREL